MKLCPQPHVGALRTYEPGLPLEEVARKLGLDRPEELVKLASNENALGPSPRAVEAMREEAARVHLYPDGGSYYLKQKLAQGFELSPEHIALGNGSNELIELLGHVFLGPGTSITMAQGAFIIYHLVAAAFQAETRWVALDANLGHDLERFSLEDDTRLVFVANPNNPSGTVVAPERIEALLERMPEHALLVLDEAYVELMEPGSAPSALDWVRAGSRVVLLRTFSKAYGLAGLRVGYAIADPEIIALLERVRQPFNLNRMAQVAALAALEDVEHLERTRAMVRQGHEFLAQACAREGWNFVPSQGNFMLIEAGEGRAAFEALQREGVVARAMDGYGLGQFLRVSIGTEAENRAFIAAFGKWMKRGG